jgi:SAM-dependent methyltransferase
MPPALLALLLGAGATVLVGLVLTRIPLPHWAAALAIGVAAGGGAWLLRMDRWWPPLLAGFPLAIWLALQLPVAPWIWGCAGLLMVLAYGAVYRTQVPLFLSRRAVWETVLAELPPPHPGRRLRFVDLGSGLGGLPRFIARSRPDVDCSGVELAPLPAAIAWLRQRTAPLPNVRLSRGDLWSEPLEEVDLVFAFLSPVPMPALGRKAAAELRAGGTLVSCEFPVPDATPTAVRESGGQRRLYVYRQS